MLRQPLSPIPQNDGGRSVPIIARFFQRFSNLPWLPPPANRALKAPPSLDLAPRFASAKAARQNVLLINKTSLTGRSPNGEVDFGPDDGFGSRSRHIESIRFGRHTRRMNDDSADPGPLTEPGGHATSACEPGGRAEGNSVPTRDLRCHLLHARRPTFAVRQIRRILSCPHTRWNPRCHRLDGVSHAESDAVSPEKPDFLLGFRPGDCSRRRSPQVSDLHHSTGSDLGRPAALQNSDRQQTGRVSQDPSPVRSDDVTSAIGAPGMAMRLGLNGL